MDRSNRSDNEQPRVAAGIADAVAQVDTALAAAVYDLHHALDCVELLAQLATRNATGDRPTGQEQAERIAGHCRRALGELQAATRYRSDHDS